MATRRGKSRFASQAALEALVRFGPELSGLKELQRTAQSTFDTSVHQAHGTANAIIGTIDQAKPQVAKIYDEAGLKQAATAGTLIGHDLAGLGHVADSIKAGAALEAAGSADRLNTAKAAALTDLTQQRVRARQGEQFAVGNAKDQFVAALEKILTRKQDLAREKGAFSAATINDLAQAAAERRLKRTEGAANRENALLTAGVDAQGHIIPGGPKDPKVTGKDKAGAKKINTDLQHGALDDSVKSAMQDVAYLKGTGSRKEILDALIQGVPSHKIGDSDQKTREIPGTKPLIAQAALELSFDGKISRKTLKKLHDRGYSVKKLGWKYASGKKLTPQQKAAQGLTRTAVDKTTDIINLLAGIGK